MHTVSSLPAGGQGEGWTRAPPFPCITHAAAAWGGACSRLSFHTFSLRQQSGVAGPENGIGAAIWGRASNWSTLGRLGKGVGWGACITRAGQWKGAWLSLWCGPHALHPSSFCNLWCAPHHLGSVWQLCPTQAAQQFNSAVCKQLEGGGLSTESSHMQYDCLSGVNTWHLLLGLQPYFLSVPPSGRAVVRA